MCGGERRESANKLISNLSCIFLQQFQHREQHTAGRSSIGAAYPFMCKRLAKVASASSPCQSCHGALSKRSRDRAARRTLRLLLARPEGSLTATDTGTP